MASTVTTGRPVGIIQWTIISAPGSYHPPHYDAGGYGTVLQILDGGAKLCAFAVPRKTPRTTPLPGDSARGWEWPAFDNCDIILVVLKVGDQV
jgi:hypothetical protein